MNAVVQVALPFWGFEAATYELVAARENQVFRIEMGGVAHAMRLHRVGYRSDAELQSELDWMAAVSKHGLDVPSPVSSRDGAVMHLVEGVQVDVLTWIKGAAMGAMGQPLTFAHQPQVFEQLGREMARLHEASDAWAPGNGFTRWHWDREGVFGAQPVWGRFWDNPTLTPTQKETLIRARIAAQQDLAAMEAELDYGLIHADLVRENVMMAGDRLSFIDFDDGGFGYRLFDVATTLFKNKDTPNFAELKAALLAGYRAIRPLDATLLPLFMFARAASYVGWIIARMDEEGATERNARFITQAVDAAHDYLKVRGGITV